MIIRFNGLKLIYQGGKMDDLAKKVFIGFFVAIGLTVLLLILFDSSPRDYLGTWRLPDGHSIKITEATDGPMPRDVINLRGGVDAKLLLPVRVSGGVYFRSWFWMEREEAYGQVGGIYDVGVPGEHAFIFWFSSQEVNIVAALRMKGGELELSDCPNNRYKPGRWVSLPRVK